MQNSLAQSKLTRQGLLTVAFPLVRTGVQALLFLLFFRTDLPRTVLAYLLVTASSAVCSGIFLYACLPDTANLLGSRVVAGWRGKWPWLAGYLVPDLLLLPTIVSWELSSFGPQTSGFLLGAMLQAASFWLLHAALLWKEHADEQAVSEGGPVAKAKSPYQYVRHPAGLALILYCFSVSLLLGSLLALVPTVADIVLVVCYTGQVEKRRLADQPAYGADQAKVKYILLPGIW